MCPQSTVSVSCCCCCCCCCCLLLIFLVAGSAPSEHGGAWFLGHVLTTARTSNRLNPDNDLELRLCSARCQRKGSSVAAVAKGSCFCGKQELQSWECVVLLPIGRGQRNVFMCGHFLKRFTLWIPDQVFSGTPFTVHLFLKMTVPLELATGLLGIGGQDLSDVTVEFLGMTPRGQSSPHVNTADRCSFNVSSNCSVEAPGPCEIRIIVSYMLSVVRAAHNLDIEQRSPDSSVRAWLHGPQGDPYTSVKSRADGSERELCLCLRPSDTEEPCNSTWLCPVPSVVINSTQKKRVRIWREVKRESTSDVNAVKVLASKQAYPTNTEVYFSALTDAQGSMEFLWDFGDSTSARTMLKTITKKYRKPGRYNVTVVMLSPGVSHTSEPLLVIIQRAVKVNRLMHQASVLQNHTVTLSCWVSAGSHLSFLWMFGDGSGKVGESTEEHVFGSVGEFTVEVTVFNLVSSASLRSHIFVVDQPCQPLPVKNMGPLTIKVPRHEALTVGVSYGSEYDCDILISGGIRYTWTLYDSLGGDIALPHAEIHRQTLTLPKYFLLYGTYTAVAKVQVIGSVVYSNYSVKVQVTETAPVAVIRGGTNVFINNKNTTVVKLDGTKSYDPDFPHNTVRMSWTCKPVSIVPSSCFDHEPLMSTPEITFSASTLKQNFDQFQFTLTTESAGRFASSDVFLTVKADLQGKVSIDCPQCQNGMSWNQPFTVQAFCEACHIPPDLLHYTWSLYRVNASSKPVQEVPFCDTVDLSVPSAIKGTPTALPPAPEFQTAVSNPHKGREMWKRHRRDNYKLEPVSQVNPEMAGSGNNFFENSTEDQDPFSAVFSPDYTVDPFESSSDWNFSFPVTEKGDIRDELDLYHDSFLNVEEGESDISAGRPTIEDGESIRLVEELEFEPGSHREEGSNLIEVRPPVVKQERTVLDLPRDPVAQWIFESYTFTGTTSSLLSFKPFHLQPGSRYMLEVTASHDSQMHFLGRAQLFFQTKPAPKGVTCQVQPSNGVELLTVFSIFCSSGKEDLLFKYSYNVGNKPPRILYQGTNFEHYFSLPVGDPSDDYKVTVSIEIGSSVDGGTTRPCPAAVTVQPQFVRDMFPSSDPTVELSQIALRNLSSLVRLGNRVELLNYICVVTNILNRLSLEPEANTQSLACFRNMLVCIVCEIEDIDQVSTLDTIHILGNLLQFPEQITLSSIRKMTHYIEVVSEKLSVDQRTLNHMISLLSHTLKAASSFNYQKDIKTKMDPSLCNFLSNNAMSALNFCLTHFTDGLEGLRFVKHLVGSILHSVSLLSLKFILIHKVEEFKVSAGFMSVFTTFQNRNTTVRGDLSVFDLRQVSVQQTDTCVVSVMTELNHNPFTWAKHPGEITGPVVNLDLFRCSTRRKILIGFLPQPFSAQLHPPNNKTFSTEYFLHHNKINYHSFNISHEHLQHVVQLRVQFTPPATRGFPVILLFRMFEKPSPSEHYFSKIHDWQWQRSVIHITLPSSSLKAPGVGYLAVLNADFKKTHRWRDTRVSYGLRVDSSLCLSWDGPRGAWSPHGCKTQATDTSSVVTCSMGKKKDLSAAEKHEIVPPWTSCHQLRPMTLTQQQMSTSFDTIEIDPFISVLYNWTVVIVLLLTMSIYSGALVFSQSFSGKRRVHYLSDNLPCEACLYAVTIHTGLCSAAEMSAKVYIVLCGENGCSQTKELQAPGHTLFQRNCQDTFITSAAESLGSLCGIHIWHDNSGPSPTWYLKRVEVCELNRNPQVTGRSWLFVSQCWLAVDKSDGRVERMLRVCNEKMGFIKVLCVRVCDYMADLHIWISAHSCPNPSAFTRCQRLSVCFLLLLGYASASTFIISQMDGQLYLELDIKDLSVHGVTTGIISVVIVLPAATLISLLFRLSEVKIFMPENNSSGGTKKGNVCFDDAQSVTNSLFETYFSWSVLQRWLQESWRKKYQDAELSSVFSWYIDDRNLDAIQSHAAINKDVVDGVDEIQDSGLFTDQKNNNKTLDKIERRGQFRKWCHYVAWLLWLLLCLSCLTVSALLSLRFNNQEAMLWIQSLFFSLLFCIFIIHPLLVFTLALVVSLWHRNRTRLDNSIFSTHHMNKSIHEVVQKCIWHRRKTPSLLQLLEARQRIRFLRLVRPPTLTELRKSRCKRKRDNLILQTVLDWCIFAAMLFLMLCVTYSSSAYDFYNHNKAVRKHLMSGFSSIQTHDEWWSWAQTSFLNALYKNTTAEFAPFQDSHILIGEPLLWKTEVMHPKAFSSTLLSKTMTTESKFGLGHSRVLAESKLKQLHSQQWIGRSTVALKVHFTLCSPAPNVFTSVTLNINQSPSGVLQASVSVQSVTVFHIVSEWDYVIVVCKIIFLILLFLRLCHQMLVITEKGVIRYCKSLCNWLEVALSVVATVYCIYNIYRTVLVSKVAELLQRQNYKSHIDLSQLATWDQSMRSLGGTLLFLLTLRCMTLLNKTLFSNRSLCYICGILISGLINMAALSCMGDHFHFQNLGVLNFVSAKFKSLNARRNVCCHGITFVLTKLLWTTLVIRVVSLSVRSGFKRRDILTTSDFVQYIKNKLFSRWIPSVQSDNSPERKTYNFEQFEIVLDELLLKLDTVSDQIRPSEVYCHKQDSPISPKQGNSKTDKQDCQETNMMQPLDLFYSGMCGPQVLSYLQSKDQREQKLAKGTLSSSNVHEKEMNCYKNSEQRRAEQLKGPRTIASLQPLSAEMVVEVLIHEERDRDILHNVEDSDFLNQ